MYIYNTRVCNKYTHYTYIDVMYVLYIYYILYNIYILCSLTLRSLLLGLVFSIVKINQNQ